MKNSVNSNMYENFLDETWRASASHLDGSHAGLVVVASSERLGEEARRAFDSSFARLGYGSGACTFLALAREPHASTSNDDVIASTPLVATPSAPHGSDASPAHPDPEGSTPATTQPAVDVASNGSASPSAARPASEDGEMLSSHDVFRIIEGLDPLCVVATDATAAAACARAYRQDFPLMERSRLFGRDARAFASFEQMLASPASKQKAWALLKSLPKLP